MSTSSPFPTHLDDGTLVRMLDDVLDDTGDSANAHLEQCPACSERFALIRQRSERVSRLLVESMPPDASAEERERHLAFVQVRLAQSRRHGAWRSPWLRAAAAVVVLAGAAYATPVGAWIIAHVFRAPSVPRVDSPGVPQRSASDSSPSWSRVWFSTEGSDLVIRLDARQRGGELIIRPSSASESSASVIAANSEELIVLPDGIRVRNDAASTASYRVETGAIVRRVVVRFGSAADTVLAAPSTGAIRLRLDGGR